jgi:hypothetical protein
MPGPRDEVGRPIRGLSAIEHRRVAGIGTHAGMIVGPLGEFGTATNVANEQARKARISAMVAYNRRRQAFVDAGGDYAEFDIQSDLVAGGPEKRRREREQAQISSVDEIIRRRTANLDKKIYKQDSTMRGDAPLPFGGAENWSPSLDLNAPNQIGKHQLFGGAEDWSPSLDLGKENLIGVTPGEFVVNEGATKQNLALLEAINENKIPKFATGGRTPGTGISTGPKTFNFGGLIGDAPQDMKDASNVFLQAAQQFGEFTQSLANLQIPETIQLTAELNHNHTIVGGTAIAGEIVKAVVPQIQDLIYAEMSRHIDFVTGETKTTFTQGSTA